MQLSDSLLRAIAPAMAVLMVLTPISTAWASPSPPVSDDAGLVGSVNVAGPVELRGVRVAREGTVFSGDTINTDADAWASLSLGSGQHVELGANTDVRVTSLDGVVQVAMSSGSLAFSSPRSVSPLEIGVASYRIVAADGAAGDVAWSDSGIGVRALDGSLRIEGDTGDALVLDPGQEVRLGGPAGPAAPAAAPRRQFGDNQFLIWSLIEGGAVGGLVLYLILKDGDEASDSNP